MRIYKTKEAIRRQLISSLEDPEYGISTKADGNGGSHKWWLTGTEDNYTVHCFGSGQGWSDQSDDCSIQNLNELVSCLWKKRASIIE